MTSGCSSGSACVCESIGFSRRIVVAHAWRLDAWRPAVAAPDPVLSHPKGRGWRTIFAVQSIGWKRLASEHSRTSPAPSPIFDEVRSRLAAVQRFRGLSGPAALASGIGVLVAGWVQFAVAPAPHTAVEAARYVAIWTACLTFALVMNYGAVAVWLIKNWSSRTRAELQTAAIAIIPSVVAGGAFTAALLARGEIGLLPGTWALCYSLGLLAARSMLPRSVFIVAIGFAAAGTALLFAPGTNALAWWAVPLTFGVGQTGSARCSCATTVRGARCSPYDEQRGHRSRSRGWSASSTSAVASALCACLATNPDDTELHRSARGLRS